ncbi:hypothetical protein LJR231_001953 [Phyllobacterium sp. LjRoot231]|uniref:hypothetical protein n=1 Tax=Phyllobacterium sp. LjRoot231 TaxID=3342289 RepID=UPI003ECFD4FD
MGSLFDPPFPKPSGLSLLGALMAPTSNTTQSEGLLGLGSLISPTPVSPFAAALDIKGGGLLGLLSDQYRIRSEWNERFSHWERSESTSETQRIERARNMVHNVLTKNTWLSSQRVSLVPQGSFTNRTNTRLEADIDLRVQHPAIKIEYLNGIDPQAAWRDGGYVALEPTFGELSTQMRTEIIADLIRIFGADKVNADGNKAIRVSGLDGSRAEVDVVPAFRLHRITGNSLIGGVTGIEGVAILSRDGQWTENYPDQHLANGRAKRLATGHQFKRTVRIVKRLRADMADRGVFNAKVPSFLIECLVYLVEDHAFMVAADDRYDRVKRVLNRIVQILENPLLAYSATEINGVKLLFGGNQAWTLETARSFSKFALAHLGNA